MRFPVRNRFADRYHTEPKDMKKKKGTAGTLW